MGREKQASRCSRHATVTDMMTFMARCDATRICEPPRVPVSGEQSRELPRSVLLLRNGQVAGAGTALKELFLGRGFICAEEHSSAVEHLSFK
jgi:hypothetical protein